MKLTSDDLLAALQEVEDPDLKKDLVTLHMVKRAEMEGADAYITIELTTPACPMKDKIRADIEAAITRRAAERGAELGAIHIEFTSDVKSPQDRARNEENPQENPLPAVKHIVAIGAGKGGVGKSTVSTNVAIGLARMGAKVGLLDGDIYGPSGPTMLGLENEKPQMRDENTMLPFEVHGIKAVTIGKLVPPDKALIWRGPMAHGAFRQLLTQTDWGELDYLIVDLPPGTGDVPLSLCQMVPLSGAVVICTPQKVAQDDARRAVRMFQELSVDVLGVIENMSYFIGDDGKEYDIFGRGGAETFAAEMNLPFLGTMPISMSLRANCDQGTPLKNWSGDNAIGLEIDRICQSLAQQISINAMSGAFVQPTLSIS